MAVTNGKYIWLNGDFVAWDDANIHVSTHALHYGSCLFEGIRAYETEDGPAVFRLVEHVDRLFNSSKIYRMEEGIKWNREEMVEIILETIRKNNHQACYIRPIVYRGYGSLGVNPLNNPVEVSIMTQEWGDYLGKEAVEHGAKVKVSTWNRFAPNTLPAMAKAAANYMNSQLINMEAKLDGYDEGIALDVHGMVSEGSGENLFVIHGNQIITPPLGNSVLPGITRNTLMVIMREMMQTGGELEGFEIVERSVPRELLYLADEVLFCGTAAEVTPVREIDHHKVGSGTRGPITKSLQEKYSAAVRASKADDRHNWLSFV
jgi:branched-chain amino acid aminotransferase